MTDIKWGINCNNTTSGTQTIGCIEFERKFLDNEFERISRATAEDMLCGVNEILKELGVHFDIDWDSGQLKAYFKEHNV